MPSTVSSLKYSNSGNRIDYIDLVKGFAILWVVWWHTCHPAILDPYYHVPIFFFVSGIFFKDMPLKQFVEKKTSTILVPFIFFYLISYPYRMAVHLWDHHTLNGFPWLSIFDVFKSMPNGDYLYVNVPIWFLLCLFNVNIIYYLLNKLPQWIQWLYVAFVMSMTHIIVSISTPFFINDAIRWTAYFAIGHLVGSNYLRLLEERTKLPRLFLILVPLYVSLRMVTVCFSSLPLPVVSLLQNGTALCFIFFIIAFFSLFQHTDRLKLLRFYGVNSLLVLGFHVPILIIFQRIVTKFWGGVNYWGGFAVFVSTALVLYFIIPLANRWLYIFLGKKHEA